MMSRCAPPSPEAHGRHALGPYDRFERPQRLLGGRGELIRRPGQPERLVFHPAEGVIGQQLHPRLRQVRVDVCRGAPDVLLVVVHAADDRDSDHDVRGQLREPPDVLQDPRVGRAGIAPVLLVVHQLEVHEDEVEALQRRPQAVEVELAAGLQGHRQAHVVDPGRQLVQEGGLRRRLPAGERDPPTAVAVEDLVFPYLPEDLLRIAPAHQPGPRAARAGVGARAAGAAPVPLGIQVDPDPFRTGGRAETAAGALSAVPADERPRRKPLRVGAPAAPERAPGQEDGRADAVPVVDGERLELHHIALSRADRGLLRIPHARSGP